MRKHLNYFLKHAKERKSSEVNNRLKEKWQKTNKVGCIVSSLKSVLILVVVKQTPLIKKTG